MAPRRGKMIVHYGNKKEAERAYVELWPQRNDPCGDYPTADIVFSSTNEELAMIVPLNVYIGAGEDMLLAALRQENEHMIKNMGGQLLSMHCPVYGQVLGPEDYLELP